MSALGKLESLANKTLVNTDIMPIQPSTGASWYKVTLSALKHFIYTDILASINTWALKQTFTVSPSVPNGAATTDAVNFQQLDAKQVNISSNDGSVIVNNSGNITGSGILRTNESDGFLNLRPDTIPTSTADTVGIINDITFDRDYIFIKTTVGWKRASLSTF